MPVHAFFVTMVVILTTKLVLEMVFFYKFDEDVKGLTKEEIIREDKIVSIVIYIHTGIDMLFNIMSIWFLWTQ